MKIGIGYDIHRLTEGRKMVLGGVKMDHPKGPAGHSDGDVLIHAICDAILGALGMEDIGVLFPDTDPAYKDISSIKLLRDVVNAMKERGYSVGNLDCVVIAEEPKVSPYREEIIKVLAPVLGAGEDSVNVKGKTSEKLGAIGYGEAIAAQAVVLLEG
ncbi:MAG: 2-C-methyl-D-erythritol 2,4-cyclodiphosphate synthase [Candidatus Omnitrophica bacterium]|nr:2-C-methyl-D-erythritol 2,4-cyclodiphosphate synthase [Candidatus Omnitrophota bacterium]